MKIFIDSTADACNAMKRLEKSRRSNTRTRNTLDTLTYYRLQDQKKEKREILSPSCQNRDDATIKFDLSVEKKKKEKTSRGNGETRENRAISLPFRRCRSRGASRSMPSAICVNANCQLCGTREALKREERRGANTRCDARRRTAWLR